MTACPSNIVPPPVEIPILLKAPWEQLPFTFNWKDEMLAVGSTVASSFWVLAASQPDGPSAIAISFDDSVVPNFSSNPSPQYSQGGTSQTPYTTTIVLAGGTSGRLYLVQNCMTTLSGLKYARQFYINCQGYTNP